jgi:hypothetical protein
MSGRIVEIEAYVVGDTVAGWNAQQLRRLESGTRIPNIRSPYGGTQ